MKPIGYTIHELLLPDGKIRYGTFTNPLLSPPISFRDLNSNPSPRLDALVNFSILDVEEQRIQSAQFIPNQIKPYTLSEFWKESEEDGVDIYLDAIRHFPESCSMVKIVAKVVDKNLNDLLRPVDIWPKIKDSSYQSQVFHAKLECRDVAMHPTALLHLSFLTIEATTLKEKLIGFSFFPLFINAAKKAPVMPEDQVDMEDQEARCLHKGGY